jgi:phage terminase small subunit
MKNTPRPPKSLTGEALAFWQRHARPLWEANILTERDIDSFALLCRVWGVMNEMDISTGNENFRIMIQFTNLLKQYQALAKQFGLLPRERKIANMVMDTEEVDEYGL